MAIGYVGTAGSAGATIFISGAETLSTLITSLSGHSGWATSNGDSILFNASLSVGSGTTTGSFTASSASFIFPQAYTFTIPNSTVQSGSSTTLTDVGIIFDGTAKSYSNAVNYGTHNWTRVVYRSQVTTGRTDVFQNTGCIFNFNNVQLTVSSTATAYPYDFIHQYNNTTVTVQGLTVTGAGGAGSANSLEVGSATGTTTTVQGLTIGGVIGVLTINNGGASYAGTQDFRSLSWPNNTTWSINYGSGGGQMYVTNPNKPSGWLAYSFTGGAGGTGSLIERYSHDITCVNASNTGISGVNVGDYRSGAFVWNTTTGASGIMTEQYVVTTTLSGGGGVTPTTYSTTVSTLAWLYGYNTFLGSRTFTPTGVGITDVILLPTDVTTLSASGVAALTSLASLDNLYDASRYWNTLNTTNIQIPSLGTNIITANGTQLNLGSYNLTIASGTTTAGNAFAVAGSTITIYGSSFATGTKFTSFTTSGTVTVNAGVTVTTPFVSTSGVTNNGTINAQYTAGSNSSGVLTLTNMISGSSIYVVPNNGQAISYTANSTTSGTYYIPPNTGATQGTWKVTKYGYLPVNGTFASNTSSSAVVSQNTDPYITQATVATVSGYTSLNSPDQIYDYAAYWETISGNIATTRLDSANGKNLSFGSSTVAFNTAASNVYNVTGTTATIKSTATVVSGATFTSFGTTGTFTNSGSTINCVYTTSSGTSTVLTLTNLPYSANTNGSYLSVLLSGVQQQYIGPVTTGSQVVYIAPGPALTYSYKTASYSYLPSTNTFSTQGYVANTVSLSTDTGITQGVVATVSGYTSLNSPDQIYDYAAYWETTSSGINTTRVDTKNGTQLSFGSANVTLNTGSTNVYSVTGGNPTIKSASTFNPGITYTSFATSGTVTLTGLTYGTTMLCPYTSSAGSAIALTLVGLPTGASLSISNPSFVQQQFLTITGTLTAYVGVNTPATWNWKSAAYNYFSSNGTFPVGNASNLYPSYTITLPTDTGITQVSGTVVSGYTTLSSPDQVYDYAAYWETTSSGIGFSRTTTKNANQLSFGNSNVILNTGASNVYVISGGNTIIKSATNFTPGTNFTSFATTSGVALTGLNYGTTMTCPYTSASGSTTVFTLTAVPSGASISISNNFVVQQQFFGPVSGTQTVYVPVLASSATWNWKVADYGYLPQTGVFTAGSSTNFYPSSVVGLGTDTGITQTNVATVSGYTTFASPDQIYDYLAYWETTSGTTGIQVTRPATKNGISVSFGSNNVILASGGNTYTYTAGVPNTLQFKTANPLPAGTTFTQINTTGTVTLSGVTPNLIYTSNLGTSATLTLTGLPASSYVYIQNASGTQQVLASGQSGSYSYSTPPGATGGQWAWSTKAVGYTSQAGSYSPSNGGLTTVGINAPQLIQSTGAIMYQGSTNSLCTVSFATDTGYADILIGNGQVTVQNVFDISERSLVTTSGMVWLANGLSNNQIFLAPTGNFLFLTHNWRLKALNVSSPNAQVLGFPLSTDGTPINSANGNILIFSTTQATDTATAVWNAINTTYTTAGTMGEQLNLSQAAAALAAALSA